MPSFRQSCINWLDIVMSFLSGVSLFFLLLLLGPYLLIFSALIWQTILIPINLISVLIIQPISWLFQAIVWFKVELVDLVNPYLFTLKCWWQTELGLGHCYHLGKLVTPAFARTCNQVGLGWSDCVSVAQAVPYDFLDYVWKLGQNLDPFWLLRL